MLDKEHFLVAVDRLDLRAVAAAAALIDDHLQPVQVVWVMKTPEAVLQWEAAARSLQGVQPLRRVFKGLQANAPAQSRSP